MKLRRPRFGRPAPGTLSAAATPGPAARALGTRRPRRIPLHGVPVAALAKVGKQVAAQREGLSAGSAAKRDRVAHAPGAALIVEQALVVGEAQLRLQDRAADLAVEGLGRRVCAHKASSSQRLPASAAESALAGRSVTAA